ncbi:MAG: hypothetical protein ABL921_09695 [Pirellula sp.]
MRPPTWIEQERDLGCQNVWGWLSTISKWLRLEPGGERATKANPLEITNFSCMLLRSPIQEVAVLTREQWVSEKFVFGLRRLQSVDWAELSSHAEPGVVASMELAMHKHMDGGRMTRNSDNIQLTRKGLIVSDALWKEDL